MVTSTVLIIQWNHQWSLRFKCFNLWKIFKMSSLLSLCKVKPPLDKYCSLVAETLASPTHIWPVFSWPLTGSIRYRVTVGLCVLGREGSISRPPFLDFHMDFPSRQKGKGNWISLPVPFPSLLVNTPVTHMHMHAHARTHTHTA